MGWMTERRHWLHAAATGCRLDRGAHTFTCREVPAEVPTPTLWYLRWYSHTEYKTATFDVTRSNVKYRGYVEAWSDDEAKSFIRTTFPGAHVSYIEAVKGSYEDVEPGGWHRTKQAPRPIRLLADWIGRAED